MIVQSREHRLNDCAAAGPAPGGGACEVNACELTGIELTSKELTNNELTGNQSWRLRAGLTRPPFCGALTVGPRRLPALHRPPGPTAGRGAREKQLGVTAASGRPGPGQKQLGGRGRAKTAWQRQAAGLAAPRPLASAKSLAPPRSWSSSDAGG